MRRRSAASNGTTLVRPLPEWGQIIQREPRATASPTDNAFIRASEHYGPRAAGRRGDYRSSPATCGCALQTKVALHARREILHTLPNFSLRFEPMPEETLEKT